MTYTQEQMDAARGLQASYGATQSPRGRRSNGRGVSSFGQSRGSHNGHGRGSYNGPGHGVNSGPYGSVPGSYFASAPGSGSATSTTTQQSGGGFPAGGNNPLSTNGSGYGSYGSPGTPRAPQPVSATTSSNNVVNGGSSLNTSRNEAVAFGAHASNKTNYTHQPAHPSSTSVTDPSSKPHGGLANSRYATTTAGSSTTMSSSFQPSGGKHANVAATGANTHVGQGAHSATDAQGSQHGGLGGSRYNNTSGAASSTVPLTSQPNSGNDISVGINGHASPAVQPWTASQTPQLSSAFTLTSANGFGVGLHSNSGTTLGPSHIRGDSNTSDVQMIDLDTPVQAEGILPLRLHGGMHDSRWASPAPLAPAHNHGVSSQSPTTDASHAAPATPSITTPSSGPFWRINETWSLARYQNATSTAGVANEASQLSESGTEPSRPVLDQAPSGTTTRGGLGASRFAQ